MNPNTDFVVLETHPVKRTGFTDKYIGSLVIPLPRKWREDYKSKLIFIDGVCQLQVQFLQAPHSGDIVMRIVEIPKQGE